MTEAKYKPIVLLILDGWGISPSWGGNALAVNSPQNMNRLWRDYPHKVLQAFTMVAGKYGIVGDSRLGHSTIAAGRRIKQDLEVVSEAIADKSFYKNKVLVEAIDHAQKNNSNLHLIGLISNGGIHAYLPHLTSLLELCHRKNFKRVYIHAITDGIDSGDFDAISFISEITQKFRELGIGQFASVIGRYYAMDRIGDYQKTLTAYNLMVNGAGGKAKSAAEAVTKSYRKNLTDFNLEPTLIVNGGQQTTISDNDSVLFFNIRSDRTFQLLQMFVQKGGGIFSKTKHFNNLPITTMTEYDKKSQNKVAFPALEVKETLGEVISKYNLSQLRLAESEKASHVTTFFNCGSENPFNGEIHDIINSKRIADITKYPQMETRKVIKAALKAIKSRRYDLILINLANVDMISHTGDMIAAGKAVTVVDEAVGQIVSENLEVGGATVITADHGNIEEMVKLNPRQDPESKHTLNPVPFILVAPDNKKDLFKVAVSSPYDSLGKILTAKYSLIDIAPTILEIMGLRKPEVMTGHSLLNNLE